MAKHQKDMKLIRTADDFDALFRSGIDWPQYVLRISARTHEGERKFWRIPIGKLMVKAQREAASSGNVDFEDYFEWLRERGIDPDGDWDHQAEARWAWEFTSNQYQSIQAEVLTK